MTQAARYAVSRVGVVRSTALAVLHRVLSSSEGRGQGAERGSGGGRDAVGGMHDGVQDDDVGPAPRACSLAPAQYLEVLTVALAVALVVEHEGDRAQALGVGAAAVGALALTPTSGAHGEPPPAVAAALLRELHAWLAVLACGDQVPVVTAVNGVAPLATPAGRPPPGPSLLSSLPHVSEWLHGSPQPLFSSRVGCGEVVAQALGVLGLWDPTCVGALLACLRPLALGGPGLAGVSAAPQELAPVVLDHLCLLVLPGPPPPPPLGGVGPRPRVPWGPELVGALRACRPQGLGLGPGPGPGVDVGPLEAVLAQGAAADLGALPEAQFLLEEAWECVREATGTGRAPMSRGPPSPFHLPPSPSACRRVPS